MSKRRKISQMPDHPARQQAESISTNKELPERQTAQEVWNTSDLEEEPAGDQTDEELDPFSSASTRTGSAFAILLGFLLRNERSEILRLAKEIGVSENTVYRWLNGTATPRYHHMQKLLEVLPQPLPLSATSSGQLTHLNSRRSTGFQLGRLDIPQDLYRRVLEQAAITADNTSRSWHIVETIFEQALLVLDPDRYGIALTYARLMPPRADGTIHSLYEAEMRGQAPWPFALDFKMYLGSNTLAGIAAINQRAQIWSASDAETRVLVALDENERSACAAPVMRSGRLAGVLIISSTQEDFMNNSAIRQTASDYANLLAISLKDEDFYAATLIKLVPMPDLSWQRQKISHFYLNRVIECARKACLSFPEAEQQVLQDLEEEFELYASNQKSEKLQKTPKKEVKQSC